MSRKGPKIGEAQRRRRLTPNARFSEKKLTSRAGLIPISRFMDKLDFERVLEESVGIRKRSEY